MTNEKKSNSSCCSQKNGDGGASGGRIAHDFNNLLTPILGYTDLLLSDTASLASHQNELRQIRQAAERAKELIARLLTFSRKQVIELKTVDLGQVIRRFETILRRTIREDIHIHIQAPPSLCPIRADVGQIEQILVNLSVNAQDAMPSGGILKIEARSVEIGADFVESHPEIEPGSYLLLSVSDTGIGMDEKVQSHLFEPFFTTKEQGKGTGLGLSTVYGIVKQHKGFIMCTPRKIGGALSRSICPAIWRKMRPSKENGQSRSISNTARKPSWWSRMTKWCVPSPAEFSNRLVTGAVGRNRTGSHRAGERARATHRPAADRCDHAGMNGKTCTIALKPSARTSGRFSCRDTHAT